MRSSHFVRFFICIVLYLSMARAFSVTVGTPTQCDGLTVSWTGGQAPFEILLTPSLKMFQNISVPASAFTNGKGSYTIPSLTLPLGTQFLLTMSDATGFGSGGTTNELTVGNPIANNNCDTRGLSPPYTFNLYPQELVQCSPFSLTYAGAILPVTIVQLIPGGKSVVFSSVNSETFNSVADVSAGTNLMFFVTDSVGRPGGISGFQQVLSASDASCLSANSPSSTSGIAPTASPSSTSSASGLSSNDVALIAGAVTGGVVVLALVVLAMCCLRRRRRRRTQVQPSAPAHDAPRPMASGETKAKPSAPAHDAARPKASGETKTKPSAPAHDGARPKASGKTKTKPSAPAHDAARPKASGKTKPKPSAPAHGAARPKASGKTKPAKSHSATKEGGGE